MNKFVNAHPAKRFFIEMLTKDIRLEDAVLDLIDNAIDSIIRHQEIDLEQLVMRNLSLREKLPQFKIDITFSGESFEIADNCGGIDFDDAIKTVFRFGAPKRSINSRLSVYGIGLKRAIFKIGRKISVTSQTIESGFSVNIDVDDWHDEKTDWKFPIVEIDPSKIKSNYGTKVKITDINEPISRIFQSGSFDNSLYEAISECYALFIGSVVQIYVNGKSVSPRNIPFSNSEAATSSVTHEKFDSVNVVILTGLQRLEANQWKGDTAGWYILCNGRVVVYADKTELTGWGTRELPAFQPKHRGFIGLALFMSDNPEALPWTTTKRGIDTDSPIFQFVRQKMVSDARQVTSFLDQRYARVSISAENSDDLEVKDNRLAQALAPATIPQLLSSEPRRFSASKEIVKRPRTVSVQFSAREVDIERARRAIGKPGLSAGKVGSHALSYFLKNEADE